MTTEISTVNNAVSLPVWRDPLGVPPAERLKSVQALQKACEENPHSPDLQAWLALAHAVNHDAYASVDALERALELDPNHFFAQLKLGEVWWRLRAVVKAEEQTIKALNLAKNNDQLQVARAQLQEIRKHVRSSYSRPTWDKPILMPVLTMIGIVVCLGVFALWQ
jgi:tetratricopeptide (TPR) repeat protein